MKRKLLFIFAGIVLVSFALICTGCNKNLDENDPEAPENGEFFSVDENGTLTIF